MLVETKALTTQKKILLYSIFINKICLSYYYFNFSFTAKSTPKFIITNNGLTINDDHDNRIIHCHGINDFNDYINNNKQKIISKAIFKITNDKKTIKSIDTFCGIGIDAFNKRETYNIWCYGYYSNHDYHQNKKYMQTDSLWFNKGDNIKLNKYNIWNETKHNSPRMQIANFNFIDCDDYNDYQINVLSQQFMTNTTEMY